MNPNAYDVFIYMLIHLLLFLIKNFILKWLLKKLSNNNPKTDNEIENKIEKLNSLREQIREISPTSEYVKYAKMERQINNLSDEIKGIESNNKSGKKSSKTMDFILNSYFFKFFMFFVNFIEYLILKNQYLEIDFENNENNILAKYFYNEDDNKNYALIPVYRILICETLVLNAMSNIIQKLF